MNESQPDINKMLFMHMISMLAMTAIQQMGKLVDPATGKAEMNLEAAQATIDMLDMLEAKTRGNLDTEEAKLLKDTLMSLKMNYVESQGQATDDGPAKAGRQTTDNGAKQTPNPSSDGHNAESKPTDGEGRTPDARPAKAGGGNEAKTPKYHKKYE